jgi:hypothetical protein
MSQLEEILQSINAAYAQLDGVKPVQVTTLTTVSDYLQLMDVLHAEALRLTDEAISLAIDAGRYIDTTATLTILRGQREQLVELNLKVHKNLDGMGSNLSLQQAWYNITGSIVDNTPDEDTGSGDNGSGSTGGDSGNTGTNTTPAFYPDSDAVVLYGDTPMLLRANDPEVIIGTAYTLDNSRMIATSREISIDNIKQTVGSKQASSVTEAWKFITDGAISGIKGLVGELISASGSVSLDYGYKAFEAYDLGEKMNEVTGKSIGFIQSGLEVLQNKKNFLEWNDEHNAFLNDTHNEFDAMAKSSLVSKIPVIGWVLAPAVESHLKINYKLQITNSFEISVSATPNMTGGNKGGILLGGDQNDMINAGNGNTLAAGGHGNDIFVAGTGQQFFAGGNGTDLVTYNFSGTNLNVSKGATGYQITTTGGLHTFNSIERLQFSDRKVALDLAQDESAGMAVRLIGAALDAPALTPQLVGWFINEFDQGNSMKEAVLHAMQTPQFTAQMPQLTDTDFVTQVFHNVTGVDPAKAQLDYFLSLLSGHGGSMSQADLLVLAANTSANAMNIDLVGLQQHGIDYF